MEKYKKLFEITDEDRAKYKQRRLEHKNKLTLEYQLGLFIGEYIVDKFLPTLSVDSLTTKNNISVTCAEGDEYRRLDDAWFNKRHSVKGATDKEKNDLSENEWKSYRAHHEMLIEKYLPKKLECFIPLLNVAENKLNELKQGISTALWDSDMSHYSTKIENIDIRDDENDYFTIITLKRSHDNN